MSSSHGFEIIYCRYYKLYIAKALRTQQNMANFTPMITEQRLDRLKTDLHYFDRQQRWCSQGLTGQEGPSQLLSWKYCHGAMTIIVPPTSFNDSHTYNTHPHTTTSTYTTRVKLCTGREARTGIMVPGNGTYQHLLYEGWKVVLTKFFLLTECGSCMNSSVCDFDPLLFKIQQS